jgi:hypothetical protein
MRTPQGRVSASEALLDGLVERRVWQASTFQISLLCMWFGRWLMGQRWKQQDGNDVTISSDAIAFCSPCLRVTAHHNGLGYFYVIPRYQSCGLGVYHALGAVNTLLVNHDGGTFQSSTSNIAAKTIEKKATSRTHVKRRLDVVTNKF